MNPSELNAGNTKKSWKKPVIENLDIEETLSGSASFFFENLIYLT